MKPAPSVPGNTPWKRLDHAVRAVLSVSKEAVLKEEARRKRLRQRQRARKKAS